MLINLKTKNRICNIFRFIPDSLYLKLLFRYRTGMRLHLNNPITYTEKINWLKIYDRNPLYPKLVDKFEVRDFVKERIGEEYLIPLYGIWNNFDSIDFTSLPDRFVLKCTHDFRSVIVVNSKNDFDYSSAKSSINEAMKFNFFYRGREWAYKNVKPRIIAEKNIQPDSDRMTDYKFFCFGGVVKYMYIASGRGKDLRFDFFDKDFNFLPIRSQVPNSEIIPEKPQGYEKMISLAEKLSYGINNVRVDLYNINGRIYFSEMTLYHACGMAPFEPYDMDVKIGNDFIMNESQKAFDYD